MVSYLNIQAVKQARVGYLLGFLEQEYSRKGHLEFFWDSLSESPALSGLGSYLS